MNGTILACLWIPAALCLCARAAEPPVPARPNIVLLLADDQDWNGLSTPMHPDLPGSRSDFYETPRLAEFAAEGMRRGSRTPS